MIHDRKIDDLIVETAAWKHSLQLFENENIYFKTRLAGILSTGNKLKSVDLFEQFQNRFLKMDSHIALLKHELREQTSQLINAAAGHDKAEELAVVLQHQLARRFSILDDNFHKMSEEFNVFLRQQGAHR